MLRRFALGWALSAMGWAGTAMALGLGDITTRSALNEPFDAEIELLSATPGELRALQVQLAPPATFERYGLDRPQFLTRLRFEVVGGPNGGSVRVTSGEPITEPFVTILVEAVWPQGRLLREYTVLLDPPVFVERGQQTPAPRAAQAAPRQSSGPAPVQRSATPAQRSATQGRSAPGIDGDSYRVQRSDTLWQIAERVQPSPDLSINQVMLALFEANPQAFDGNINRLNAGALLSIPSADQMRGLNRTAAVEEVRRQNQQWRGSRGERQLVLTQPDEGEVGAQPGGATSGTGQAASGDDSAARALREELADRERLIAVRDQEIADLQRRLEELQNASSPADALDDTGDSETEGDPAAATSPGVDLEDDQIFVDDSGDRDTAVDEPDATGAEAETPAQPVAEERTRPVVPAPAQQESWFDQVKGLFGSTWVLAGLGLLALLLIGAVIARIRNRGDADSTGTWEALEDFDQDDDGTHEATSRLRAMADDDDDSILVVESETAAKPAAAAAPETFSVEDTFSSETAINLDQSDPIAEADFHMAYGLYDQAADLVKGAAVAEPERRDLKAKLAEIYFVWGNQDGFLEAAQSLHDSLGGETDEDWDKIRIMGQQIAPDHALFAGGSAAAIGSVDIDVAGDGGVSELDVDFAASDDGDIAPGSSIDGDAEGLDFAFEETGANVATPDDEDDILDLDADDFFDDDSDAPTVERPMDDDPDAPTVERPMAGDSESTQETPTIESEAYPADGDTAEVPLPGTESTPPSEATAEINLDDLGLDLSGLDATNEREVSFDLDDDELDLDSSIETLGLDDKSLEDIAAEEAETQLAPSADDDAETQLAASADGDADATMLAPASIEDTLVGAAGDAETMLSPEFGGGQSANDASSDDEGTLGATGTGRVPTLTDSDVDLDLDDLTAALSTNDFESTGARVDDETVERPLESAHRSDLDEDVFEASMADDVDDDSPTGRPQPALEEAASRTMTEVGTKLDLARAYIDMGDPDGARSILEEVAAEGDESQQQEARKLLGDLPG